MKQIENKNDSLLLTDIYTKLYIYIYTVFLLPKKRTTLDYYFQSV